MDGSTNQDETRAPSVPRARRHFGQELEQLVRESEAHLARVQEQFDREEERLSDHAQSNRFDDRLADAKASLKAAKKRLAHYKARASELEPELVRLNDELHPDRILEAASKTRPLLVDAALAQVRAFSEFMRLRTEFFEKLRRMQELERDLISDDGHRLEQHRQPGFSVLNQPARASRSDVLAALERLFGTDDALARSLSRDQKGQLKIAGIESRLMFDWAGI
jgi:hypothetical protein